MTESIFTPDQDSSTPKGIERRRDPRAQVLKAAKMVYGNFHKTAINCTLVDASESGVRVETGVMIQVPEKLQLQVPGQAARWARRRWAIGNQIGLEFINPRPLDFALN
jgi:hypothetical protein